MSAVGQASGYSSKFNVLPFKVLQFKINSVAAGGSPAAGGRPRGIPTFVVAVTDRRGEFRDHLARFALSCGGWSQLHFTFYSSQFSVYHSQLIIGNSQFLHTILSFQFTVYSSPFSPLLLISRNRIFLPGGKRKALSHTNFAQF